MAKMIPTKYDEIDFHGSYGEMKMFKALSSLPDEYVIFHSVSWNRRDIESRYIKAGEADFTIFHPSRGLLVIEVKSGGISFNNGSWLQTNTLTKEQYKMKDPLEQAQRSKFTFLDIFTNRGMNIPIVCAVAFPSVENIKDIKALPPSYSSEIIITNEKIKYLKRNIDHIFDYYSIRDNSLFPYDSKNVTNTLAPNFEILPNLKSIMNEALFEIHRLTNQQSNLLNYLEEQKVAAIQGGAGTGKTLIAIEKARRLGKSGVVLFLCFNRFLLEQIRKNITSEDNVEVHNMFTLYNKLALDGYNHADVDENTLVKGMIKSCYTHIVIDEGQDFDHDYLELFYLISKEKRGCFYLFYDKHQLVHYTNFSIIDEVECRLVLTVNCRNTKAIAISSNNIIGLCNTVTKSALIGPKPTVCFSDDVESLISDLAKRVSYYRSEKIEPEKITILTLKTEEKSLLKEVTRIHNIDITNEIGHKGKILFTSARKFKGLESEIVIIIDIDESSLSLDADKKLCYVAQSRAKMFLDLFICQKTANIELLAENLTGKKSKAKVEIVKAFKSILNKSN